MPRAAAADFARCCFINMLVRAHILPTSVAALVSPAVDALFDALMRFSICVCRDVLLIAYATRRRRRLRPLQKIVAAPMRFSDCYMRLIIAVERA